MKPIVGPSEKKSHRDEHNAAVVDITAFAKQTTGFFEERFTRTVEYAFDNYAIIFRARELRRIVGGGIQATAQLVIERHRKAVHQKMHQQVRTDALTQWIAAGMSPQMPGLTPKEVQLATAIQNALAQREKRA